MESPFQTDRNMDPSQDLSTAMLSAVREHNLDAFRQALERGFDVRFYVGSKNSSEYMPFVEKVALSRFSEALQVLLIETQPCVVRREDAVRAFHASVKSEAPPPIITVFIEASILGTLPVLSLTDSYRYAMEYCCWRPARCAVDDQGFNANCCLQLSGGAWERPIHSAIRRNQYETATRLLQLGAEVDAPNCYGITALMMACGMVSVDSVRLLLSRGADPNSADGIRANGWPLAALEYPGSMFSKPQRPLYQNLKTNIKRWEVTKNADKIIGLMVKAGLRPSPGGWLQRTPVVAHMSREAGQVLRAIIDRMPKLSEVATVQGRQSVGQLMSGDEGAGSIETMDNCTVPCKLMEQLNINVMISQEIDGRHGVGQLVTGSVGAGSNATIDDDCTLPCQLMKELSIDVILRENVDRMPKLREVTIVQDWQGVGELVSGNGVVRFSKTVDEDNTLPCQLMKELSIDVISREIVDLMPKLSELAIVQVRQGIGELVSGNRDAGSNETVDEDNTLPCQLMKELSIDVISREIVDLMPKLSELAIVQVRQGIVELVSGNRDAGSNETVDEDNTLPCKLMKELSIDVISREIVDLMPKLSELAIVQVRQGIVELISGNRDAGSNETVDEDNTLPCKLMKELSIDVISREIVDRMPKLSELCMSTLYNVQGRQSIGDLVSGNGVVGFSETVDEDNKPPCQLMEQMNIDVTD